jgi:hypothetical protein
MASSSAKPEVAAAQLGAELPAPSSPSSLDGGQRLQVIDVLSSVLGGAYCHLPQKRAGFASDPVQALQLLRRRCVELTDGEFHLALTGIVTGLRDAHTRYRGPSPVRGAVAALPFLIEQYGPDPSFVVSKVAQHSGIRAKSFRPGVRLRYWNGIPFARAVDLYADRETGGRPDSRRARALESFTFRALAYGPPPDEHWVVLGYDTLDGSTDEIKVPWRVLEPSARTFTELARARLHVALDPAAAAVRQAKKLMFAPSVWDADRRGVVATPRDGLATEFQNTLAARTVVTSRGEVGYLRIWSFEVDDHEAWVNEVIRLVGRLPQDGLIIDVRSNPGGLIWAAERLPQLFTDATVEPTRFSLLASALTRAMVASPFNRLELSAWAPSLEDAVATGEQYSQPLPITEPAWCNDIGRRYPGPVVAVADPNTYSSGDLFSAGFVDNQLGPLVTVGQATGAGGANVWPDSVVRDALAGTAYAFDALPEGVGFTLAIRRAIRSGVSDGLPIEDLGIPGIPYTMTQRDLLEDNADLLEFCATLLPRHPSHRS